MTLREFFRRLPKDYWYFDGARIRRRKRPEQNCQCPITAALNPRYAYWNYKECAKRYGMSERMADEIAKAADYTWWIGAKKSTIRLRERLKRHCGLSGT